METTVINNCGHCKVPLPAMGYYCGSCLTQFKCKSCNSYLEKDYAGCVNCGTPKEAKANTATNVNTFRMHEKQGERSIEATFSDNAAKELANMMKENYALKLSSQQIDNYTSVSTTTESARPLSDIPQHPNNQNIQGQTSQPNVVTLTQQEINYPTLLAIGMKNLPGNGTEWVVVCAFYASNFGEEIFSRQALIDKYKETDTFDENKRKGLSIYITMAVKANYINPLTNGFSILPKGVEKAKEVISRTNGSAPKVKGTSKSKKNETEGEKKQGSRKSYTSSKTLADIDFYPDGKESLKDFYQKFNTKNDYENNLLFVYYFQETLKITPITLDHIHSCYDELNLRIPENIKMSVQNTKGRKKWIESESKGNLAITIKGRNKIKHWDEN